MSQFEPANKNDLSIITACDSSIHVRGAHTWECVLALLPRVGTPVRCDGGGQRMILARVLRAALAYRGRGKRDGACLV